LKFDLVNSRRRFTALRELLAERRPSLLLVDEFPGQGAWLFEQECALSLEGIVSKRLDAPYESGVRSPAWVKVKRPGAVPPATNVRLDSYVVIQ
jgi:bifunctional non-homologous end joining protein LigD